MIYSLLVFVCKMTYIMIGVIRKERGLDDVKLGRKASIGEGGEALL